MNPLRQSSTPFNDGCILGKQRILAHLIIVSAILLYTVPVMANGMYRCVDDSGRSIFTDSPVQLGRCTPLSLGNISTLSSSTPEQKSKPSPSLDMTPTQSPQKDTITVPVEQFGPLLVVSATLNDTHIARFILDTGASLSILSRNLALDLGLLPATSPKSVTLKTAGGPVQAELIQINSIRLARAEVRHSAIAIFDLPDIPEGVEGILGLTFLRHFEVTLDIVNGQLHLRAPAS